MAASATNAYLELISSQMVRGVKIEDIGEIGFLPEEVVDRFKLREETPARRDLPSRSPRNRSDRLRS